MCTAFILSFMIFSYVFAMYFEPLGLTSFSVPQNTQTQGSTLWRQKKLAAVRDLHNLHGKLAVNLSSAKYTRNVSYKNQSQPYWTQMRLSFQMRLSTVSVEGMELWKRKYKLLTLVIQKMWYVAIISTKTSTWLAELKFKILSSFCSFPDFNLKFNQLPNLLIFY